jgi:predicted transcriptional regulator
MYYLLNKDRSLNADVSKDLYDHFFGATASIIYSFSIGGKKRESRPVDKKSDGTNYTIASEDDVFKALEIMAEANISAVMVTDKDRIIGIFTERDYIRKCEIKGLSAKGTPVGDLMTEKMVTVSPDTSIDECMELMKKYKIRHLPVLEKDSMVGMVSMRDVVDIILSDRESAIIGLENHILSSGFST